ncbi:beta-lactamase family protein [Flavobacterium piscinae]|uniref:serine hydrolase domain-containing protein n=1 Tax=Flavobacterium piscinae TaxID=2506424 RepID=UPI0019B53EF5|nr:serine hydrolase domain-containing protein [Flavobacterium piscinae]MBC8884082.1 beta-lactamase family protein [Flavobacterium piscinae]
MWTSTAKFTHVWLKKNEDWVLAEALSYDHQSPDINSTNLNNIEKLLEKSNVPAMGLGIIENGKLTKVEVYGTLDKIQKAPYNTIFKVASLTKPVFALTVLKLIDAGLLKMDEPLHQYWIDPEIKNDKRYKKLTPYLVLTHQTGFPNWRYLTNEKNYIFNLNQVPNINILVKALNT